MPHHHDHDDGDYYLDHVCLTALSAAFGAICLALYFWQTRILELMLAKQFHSWVGASGGVLSFLACVRATSLWFAMRKSRAHDHGGLHKGHTHQHPHEHGWAPWRYVVLLIPIVLFLLGLPNKGPTGQAQVSADFRSEFVEGATLVGTEDLWRQLVMVAALHSSEPAIPMSFKDAYALAHDPVSRKEWQGKMLLVRGQYGPRGAKGHPQLFSLLAFRLQHCGADLLQYDIPVACKEPLPVFGGRDWLAVKGRVDFRLRQGSHVTILLVGNAASVNRTEPGPPYFE